MSRTRRVQRTAGSSRGIGPVSGAAYLLVAVLALTAVVTMHGLTSAHGGHVASGVAAAPSAMVTTASGSHHGGDHGSGDRATQVAGTTAVACVFAVLIAGRRLISGLAPAGRLLLPVQRMLRRRGSPPDPPVPRAVTF